MVGTLTALFRGIGAVRKSGSVPPSDPRLAELWGQEPTVSGATVSEETALNISAVFCAVNLISNAFASFPAKVFEWLPGGNRAVAVNHPAHNVLHRAPNNEMPPARFCKLLSSWAPLWGAGYAEIERNLRLDPIGLWPIHPSRVWAKRNAAGQIVYEVYNDNGGMVEVADDDMLRLMGLSKDGVSALSVVSCARESMGVAVAAEEYGGRFFANDAVPRAYIKHPGKLSQGARDNIRKPWQEAYGGTRRHGMAVIDEGMELHTLGMPNEDAQFLETRAFQIVEIARWFNIPPHMLKDLSRATFSNIEHQAIEFVMDSVMPWVLDFEQECGRKLLTDAQRDTHFVKMNVAGRLRGDSKARADYYKTMTGIGAYSINRVLELEDENGIGPAGDKHYVDMNRATAEQMAEQADKPKPEPPTAPPSEPPPEEPPEEKLAALRTQIAEAHKPLLADTVERMLRIEIRAAERAAKKAKRLEDVLYEVQEWAPGFFEKHAEKFRAAAIPPMEALAGAIRATLPAEPADDDFAEWVATHTAALTDRHIKWGCEQAYELVRAPAPTEWARDQAAVAIDDFVWQSTERYGAKGDA